MPIRLTDADRARVKHHLAYLLTEVVGSVHLGVPGASQPMFLVEQQMDRLIPEAVAIVQNDLNILDRIEAQMVDALKRLKAQAVGEIKLRSNNDERTEGDLLEREHHRWATKLADDLGVPLNPFSERIRKFHGGGAYNVNVIWDS